MTKKLFNSWIVKFGKAWCKKDVDKVMSLFDKKNITYFESVFNSSLRKWVEIKKLWQVVPNNQKDITFSHKIILYSKNQGIINWRVTRFFLPTKEKQSINGIFFIKLNNKNLCTYFKQWRMVKIN